MATRRTEATELSLAFGILGISEPSQTTTSVVTLFDGSLSQEKYLAFLTEFHENSRLYSKFINVGLGLRKSYFKNTDKIHWIGPNQQASSVTSSKDLFIPSYNMPLSCKENSDVVSNSSPYNLFVNLPSGLANTTHSENWYLEKAPEELQNLYTFGRLCHNTDLPESVKAYFSKTNKTIRKAMITNLEQGSEAGLFDMNEFLRLYKIMCDVVSQKSADVFNENLNNIAQNRKVSVFENIIKLFFRVNSIPYILAGIDNHQPFAIKIPDITTWKTNWSIQSICALPQLGRGQSVVVINIELLRKSDRTKTNLPFHCEIRWSHGKLCGNPESKLYKDFNWKDVPFFDSLVVD